ncbi:TPA: hypothetical protein JBJ46_15060 [Legionella pneumophila]|nr:hypothetical protein [Legionella pneumophila]
MPFKNQEKESAAVLFTILDELINPNLVCDQHGIILFANKAYKKWRNKPHKNQPFWIACALSLDIPDYFKEAIEKKIETQSTINCDEKSFVIHIIPIRSVVIHDILYVVYFEDINSNNRLTDDNQFIQQSFLNTLCAFSELIESRDPLISGHQKRVASLSLNIAAQAHITEPKLIFAIYYGALIHDIGKIAIPMEYWVELQKRGKCELMTKLSKRSYRLHFPIASTQCFGYHFFNIGFFFIKKQRHFIFLGRV